MRKLFLLLMPACFGAFPSLAATNVGVIMGDYFFRPTNITIHAGDTVTWTNKGLTTHDTTHRATPPLWESPSLAQNRTYSFTFSNAGYYPYFCFAHRVSAPQQTGSVSVLSINLPPQVALTNPPASSVFLTPATLQLGAHAQDDGAISQVQFYSGSTILGADASAPFTLSWTNPPPGKYSLKARAIDNSGLSATSTVVQISVVSPILITNNGSRRRAISPSNIVQTRVLVTWSNEAML